jgi:hypothetical protein
MFAPFFKNGKKWLKMDEKLSRDCGTGEGAWLPTFSVDNKNIG